VTPHTRLQRGAALCRFLHPLYAPAWRARGLKPVVRSPGTALHRLIHLAGELLLPFLSWTNGGQEGRPQSLAAAVVLRVRGRGMVLLDIPPPQYNIM
jgi:hypothetical protein